MSLLFYLWLVEVGIEPEIFAFREALPITCLRSKSLASPATSDPLGSTVTAQDVIICFIAPREQAFWGNRSVKASKETADLCEPINDFR